MASLAELFAQLYGEQDQGMFDVRPQQQAMGGQRNRLLDYIRSEFLGYPTRNRLDQIRGGQTQIQSAIQQKLAQALGQTQPAPDMTASEQFRNPQAQAPSGDTRTFEVTGPTGGFNPFQEVAQYILDNPGPAPVPAPAPVAYEPRPPPAAQPKPKGNIGSGVIGPIGGTNIGSTSGTPSPRNIGESGSSPTFGAIGSSSQKKKK